MLHALRVMGSMLMSRMQFARGVDSTFDGERNFYDALGYKQSLSAADYRRRFNRGGIARRVVSALPRATWRGGGELIEDQSSTNQTTFEAAWELLDRRLTIWPMLQRADTLAGIGRFAVLFIGGPGSLEQPLQKVSSPDQSAYLAAHSEDNVEISEQDLESDIHNPRYMHPNFYRIKNLAGGSTGGRVLLAERKIHYTRILHLADGITDNSLYGTPRLEAVWNYLDDLTKLVGGGSEAFWLRANQGLHVDVDKDLNIAEPELDKLRESVDEYVHNIRRFIRTRGTRVTSLGSEVASFATDVDALITLIAGTSEIPKRILVGSEAGELASTQDRENWSERVADRRAEYAEPFVLRPFVDRMISINALPKPTEYQVRWPEIRSLSQSERANNAVKWSTLNKDGIFVVDPNEIRDICLGLEPTDEFDLESQLEKKTAAAPVTPAGDGASSSSEDESGQPTARAATATVVDDEGQPPKELMRELMVAARRRRRHG
jgi:hypothetical protein